MPSDKSVALSRTLIIGTPQENAGEELRSDVQASSGPLTPPISEQPISDVRSSIEAVALGDLPLSAVSFPKGFFENAPESTNGEIEEPVPSKRPI